MISTILTCVIAALFLVGMADKVFLGGRLGLVAGFDLVFMLRSLSVAFVIVALLVVGILRFRDAVTRGKLVVVAFSTPVCYALGSHLAFAQTMMPQYTVPMVVGKLVCGVLASALGLALFGRALGEPSGEGSDAADARLDEPVTEAPRAVRPARTV